MTRPSKASTGSTEDNGALTTKRFTSVPAFTSQTDTARDSPITKRLPFEVKAKVIARSGIDSVREIVRVRTFHKSTDPKSPATARIDPSSFDAVTRAGTDNSNFGALSINESSLSTRRSNSPSDTMTVFEGPNVMVGEVRECASRRRARTRRDSIDTTTTSDSPTPTTRWPSRLSTSRDNGRVSAAEPR